MSQKTKFQWQNISFSANQVLGIMVFIISTISGIVWVLYTTGKFSPDIELGQEASSNRYAYERLVEEKGKTDDENRKLHDKILILSEKLKILNDGLEKEKLKIELKKIETEERISTKKIEIVQLELKLKKGIAEIERQTSMVRACVDATNSGEILREDPEGLYRAHVLSKPKQGTNVLSDCLEQYYKEFGYPDEHRKQ